MNNAYSQVLSLLLLIWAAGTHAQNQSTTTLPKHWLAEARAQSAQSAPVKKASFTVEGGTCEPGASAPAPDPTFGTDGLVLIGFDIDTSGSFAGKLYDNARAVAVQADGKVLVGGFAVEGPDALGREAALMRLLPNGQLDSEFGDGGRVLLGVRPVPGNALISEIDLQADGRIVLFGTLCPGENLDCDNQNLFFARLNSDGSFDTSFDFNGTRVLDPSGFSESANGLVIQPDGKLLGTGSSIREIDQESLPCALVVRLNPDGSNDTGFGDDGFGADGQACLLPDIENELSIAYGSDLVRLADGRILVAGGAGHTGTGNMDMTVFRLLADGQLDTSFGDQGWRFVAFDQGGDFLDWASAIAVDAMDRIVLAGGAETLQFYDMGAARLLPDGALDGDFGTGGRVVLTFDDDDRRTTAIGITFLDDGRILLGGNSFRLTEESFPSWVQAGAAALLASDGSPDPCFGDDGRWVQELPEDHRGEFFSLAQGAGRVYLAGWADAPDPSTTFGTQQDFMITAFGGLPLPDAVFADRFEQ